MIISSCLIFEFPPGNGCVGVCSVSLSFDRRTQGGEMHSHCRLKRELEERLVIIHGCDK